MDEALGLTDFAGDALTDNRVGKNGRHSLVLPLRQSVFGRIAADEDVNDAERLARHPAMCWIDGRKAVFRQAASASRMGWFETQVLASTDNLAALQNFSGQWVDAVYARRPLNKEAIMK